MNKKFKYGLKLWSINTDAYKTEAVKLYEKGYCDFIELYSVPGTTDTLKDWKTLNLPFIIHGPHYAHELNLANADCFKNNMKLVKETQIFADELKAEYIVFHPGVGGKITETIRQVNMINDKRILIENKPHDAIPQMKVDFCTGSKPEEIKAVLQNTNNGFCFDVGHAIAASNSLGIDYVDFLNSFIDLKPTLYHLSDTDMDAKIDKHYNFGKGNMDIKKVLSMLPDNSTITIETAKASKENLDDYIEDINLLSRILSKNLV